MTTIYNRRSLNNYIQWYFGNVCNASCSYCLNAHTLSSYNRNMTFAETERTVRFINDCRHVYHVTLIGGEPTCFEHCLWATEHIDKPIVSILTNGLNVDVIEQFMRLGRRGHQVIVCVSLHYELYLADRLGFLERIDRIVDAVHGNPFVRLEFALLLDGSVTTTYTELFEKIVDEREACGYFVNVSYVRRTYDAGEFVRNYVAVNVLPERIRAYVRERLNADRLDILKPNPFIDRPCPMLSHYLYIDIDGTLRSSDCPQAIRTTASIFDDNFNINKHTTICTCRQPHAKNNSSCELVHGILK